MNTKEIANQSILEKSNQALLEALKKQALRVPLIMTVVIALMVEFTVGTAPLWLILLWAALAFIMQVLRSTILFQLPSQTHKSTEDRLRIASLLSLVNGIVLASSAFLFGELDATARSVFSVIMIGLVAGTVATSHGYRPIFLGFVVPVLGSVMGVWAFASDESLTPVKLAAIILLFFALAGVLHASAKDVYASFVESFALTGKLEAALEAEQSANAAKTRFLAAASHDLRQPLHTLSLLSAALTQSELDDRSSTIAQRMSLTMEDLSSELDSLLDMSKLDASVIPVNPSEFNINTSITRLVGEYDQAAKNKNIDISFEKEDEGKLVTDRFLFERIVRNLLDNAVKYTESGSITIRAQKVSDTWRVFVQDSGIGIPYDEQDNIWEEFYQLRNVERDRQKGLGLGLSIVTRLTELLGGSIQMKSVVGEGTEFIVTVPAISQSPIQTENTATAFHDLPIDDLDNVKGANVLVIDDDKDVRSGTRMLLENCGLHVKEAAGAKDAVASLHLNTPDIVLCDLRLPDTDDGFKTIAALRERQPDLPIIIVSGESSPEKLQHADAQGLEFIAKPVHVKHLLNRISSQLHAANK